MGYFQRQRTVLLALLALLFTLGYTAPQLNAANTTSPSALPPARVHGLPPQLGKLVGTLGDDDYFDQVQPTPVGYLLWSRFPVQVYVQTPTDLTPGTAEAQRFQSWLSAVQLAIADWGRFFPLELTNREEQADIRIFYREPPLARQIDPETGLIRFGRARTAQARYQFYWDGQNPPYLRHRMDIDIRPGLAPLSTQATARHELGHALGIWGHSDRPEDVLYPAQTANIVPISQRDLRTLYLIYQQPTRLGWPAQ